MGFGPVRINQTTGSMVSQIGKEDAIHWLTGTAAPCLSLFKPVWMSAGLPDQGIAAEGKDTPDSLWWQHERFHRAVILDYSHRKNLIDAERMQLQNKMLAESERMNSAAPGARLKFSDNCFNEGLAETKNWTSRINMEPIRKQAASFYRSAWKKINQEADLSL
jgi:dipeptidase